LPDEDRQAPAEPAPDLESGMTVDQGVHHSTIAISVLGSTDVAVPAAVYGVVMFPVAAVFGWVVARTRSGDVPEAHQPIG
jgi:hypothetical protein